ncbi:zinc finger protein 436-like [Uranotaenia lowii]|uniref:zinc finger protein 436-like n=1 Tax=Uranotaenia lowii TaxID=190385 RepID=UPI002478EBBC|nr:zinc finger protein 436-like [Uranotaenia lowii]
MDRLWKLDRMCRTCLVEGSDFTDLYQKDSQLDCKISSMVSACSSMKIHENDGLPGKICQSCIEMVRNAFQFRTQCEVATRSLKSLADVHNIKFLESSISGESQGTQTEQSTTGVPCDRCHTTKRTSPRKKVDNSLVSSTKSWKMLKEERIDPEPVSFVEVEYLRDSDSDGDISKLDIALEPPLCKVEVFENVEFLADTSSSTSKKVKNEPIEENDSYRENSPGPMADDFHDNDDDEDDDDDDDDDFTLKEIKDRLKPTKTEQPTIDDKESETGEENKCNYCDKVFKRATHLKRHILTHTGEKNFKCDACDKAFSRRDHLVKHEASFHSTERPYPCQMCEKTFKRAEHLRTHMDSRHSENRVEKQRVYCEICNKGFVSPKTLETHIKAHSEEKVFKCEHCEEEFTDRTRYRNHIKKNHSQGSAFLCSECGMSFLRNDYLQVHMRRHMGIKPFKCKFCPKGFPRATDLRVHEKYHTNEKPHLCNICGKGFHRAYNLVVHSRTHNGVKPYQCPHCPKSFAQGNDLKAHVRRHTGERYRCDICSEGFIQAYQLTNHKRSVHNIESDSITRRVRKFLTPVAQEQQVRLQKHHQQLEQLLAQQKELEQKQQQEWNVESNDSELQKKILETKERIQDVERELEDINNRLQEELDRQQAEQPHSNETQEDLHEALVSNQAAITEPVAAQNYRPVNLVYGHQFLNDPSAPPRGLVKMEHFQ